jgi:nucleotide-binding universal stress UspA family protein
MYRHILIATDGSVLAEKGVSHGLSLAKSVGAKVTALIVEAPLNVFDVRESRVRQMSEAFAQHAELTKQHAAKVLNHVADSAKAAGVPCQTVQVEHDHPYQAIPRPQRTRAAISSSWPRTGGAGFPRFCSGA